MYYGEVSDNKITIQISGSPFVWVALIAFLPQILSIVGVVIALISVYLLVSSIPNWVYGLGAVAIILLLVVPKILPKMTGGEK